jgi:outer membrane protein assembly factor BamD (BamD/ComL family)
MTIGLVAGIVAALVAALKASGCGWDYYTDHSVRFNGYRNATDFARLPRLPDFSSLNQNRLFAWDDDVGYVEENYVKREKRREEIDALWDSAAEFEGNGGLVEERQKLREYIDATNGLRQDAWGGPKDLQARRNSAFDKLDALTALDHGSPSHVVSNYLRARFFYDEKLPVEDLKKSLSFCRTDRNLHDNVAYLEAALFYRDGVGIGVESFAEVARRYPNSEKREALLFMSAVDMMKSSRSYDGNEPQEPDASLRDEDWESARRGFQQVMREYPKGRYYVDAQGWLAHLWLRAGERPNALADYYRMLSSDNETARAEAVISIAFVRHKAAERDMAKLEALIAGEPRTALAYAYHEIYNYAVRHRCQRYDYGFGEDKCEPKRVTDELQRIAAFATGLMTRYPNTPAGGGFVLRVAEAQLELENNADAARLARRALALGIRGDQRAEALWVAGAAEHRLRRYDTARRELETLVRENQNNRYTEGARRLLAMLLEDSGDLEGALDEYLALDYRYDVAYFVDVLMTPGQLADFIEKRPALEHRDEILYALGIRYLRERQWGAAKDVFLKIRTLGRNADESYYYRRDNFGGAPEMERVNPKERDCDPTIRGVRLQWIEQDLRTANDLETLERQVQLAQGDEAKAEALYQVASYQFERSLLFYNPIAWKGIRHYLLVDLDHDGGFRQGGESQLLFDYMQKHDMAANSLPIFLEVVRRFPNTRAARDALFTAAVCHERLAEYNTYWRDIYAQGGHAGERMVTYCNVRAAYPKYRLPRGTLGWEPASRTVNGAYGWDQPPKPKPRPSRWARAARLVNGWANDGFKLFNRLLTDVEFVVGRVWQTIVAAVTRILHWTWILAIACWLRFLWRRAREARALMNEALAQCKPRPEEVKGTAHITVAPGVVLGTLDKYLGHDLRDKVLESGRDTLHKLRQLCSDRRGRSLVAFYAATHGLFAGLLLRLILNW